MPLPFVTLSSLALAIYPRHSEHVVGLTGWYVRLFHKGELTPSPAKFHFLENQLSFLHFQLSFSFPRMQKILSDDNFLNTLYVSAMSLSVITNERILLNTKNAIHGYYVSIARLITVYRVSIGFVDETYCLVQMQFPT